MNAGTTDLAAAAAALRSRLPEPLAPLAEIAYNYRWSWTPGGPELFASVDPKRWEACAANPVRLLQETHPDRLAAVAGRRRVPRAPRRRCRRRSTRALAEDTLEEATVTHDAPAAFFCAEYAVHGSLPVYSGGLGVLAGDILKEASDRALPLVAVGLMYRHGYFRQRIDASGWQHEYWVETDPDRVPGALVTGDDGEPVTVTVPLGDRELVAQIWRVDVGRVPLLLLDADRPENDVADRWITSRLYVGDGDVRLSQYLLLGIGGVRALHALGVEPGVVHLNEGHAAFATLELARTAREADGGSTDDAFEAVRRRTVFTTHTPVPAGNDTYPAATGRRAPRRRSPPRWASTPTSSCAAAAPTPTTRASRSASRSSRCARRGSPTASARATARSPAACGRACGPTAPSRTCRSRTSPTACTSRPGSARRCASCWTATSARAGWTAPSSRPRGTASTDISDADLWAARSEQRRELIELVRARSVTERLARGDTPEYVRAAVEALDPDVLTIGFARRVATYKRLDLLLRDVDRALALLGDADRPVQFLLAGKAHPRDDDGKRLVQRLFEMKGHPQVGRRVVYLDDYDVALGAAMTRGCDIWVNVPRPPLEASGTSGIKSAVNGGLQLSVLDGWWPEAYDGTNGWAIGGEVDDDHGAQDWRHAQELYALLLEQALPRFYDRGEDGLPVGVAGHGPRRAAHDRARTSAPGG